MNDYFIPELLSSFVFFLLERQITDTIAFLFKKINVHIQEALRLIQKLGNVKANSPNSMGMILEASIFFLSLQIINHLFVQRYAGKPLGYLSFLSISFFLLTNSSVLSALDRYKD